MTPISKRQHARFYIYKKQKKCKTFIYTKIQTLCKQQDNLCYVFIHKNSDTLHYAILMKFLELAFICIEKAWHFLLHEVFIYKNPDTSQKARQFALHFFIHKKPDTLGYAIFHGIFEIAEGIEKDKQPPLKGSCTWFRNVRLSRRLT